MVSQYRTVLPRMALMMVLIGNGARQFLRTCSGEGHGRCNFFIQGGIASKVASM